MPTWHYLTITDDRGRDVGYVTRDLDETFPYAPTCAVCRATGHRFDRLTAALSYLTRPGHHGCPLHELAR